jgi:hypothetical protein
VSDSSAQHNVAVRTVLARRSGAIAALAAIVAFAFGFAGVARAATSSDTSQFSVVAGSLSFGTSPDVPDMPTLTLNGQAQTLNATMGNFSVADATGSGSGWNVTVNGDSSASHSAVFKQYCPGPSACGSDGAAAYVSGGQTLAANSLTVSSSSASFTAQNGTTGTAPSFQCTSSACNVDSASAVKVISAASGAGMGTYQAGSWGASSLALSAPTTIRYLSNGEVYHLDLVWTLNTGP